MSTEAIQPHVSIDIDQVYQDYALALLDSIPVGQTVQINFLDGRDIAQALLLSATEGPEELEHAQTELVYGDPDSSEHRRPSITTSDTLMAGLIEVGFELEEEIKATNQLSIPGHSFLIRKTHKQHAPNPEMTSTGLPKYTEGFYTTQALQSVVTAANRMKQLFPMPKVLNIGSGSEKSKQFPFAVNIDISSDGHPDVVADGANLPFEDESFTVINASHVLEHFLPSQIPSVLNEWVRVLHPRGVLRIAVPDGNKTLTELRDGNTEKGEPSYSIPGGSAPLTQLLGLGAESSMTDPRWRHHILFTADLLLNKLSQAGLAEFDIYDEDEALSYISGTSTDETNSYSLRIEALREREPHKVSQVITEYEYQNMKDKIAWESAGPLSILIPVNDEEANLPTFLEQLRKTVSELEELGLDFEVIFVLNGCTDSSAAIISNFIDSDKKQRSGMCESEIGIMSAFKKGLNVRTKSGLVAKIDVDTLFDYWTIPLLIRELISDRKKQVTYAEVRPLEELPNRFNMGEYYQEFRSTRLYYHGRVSLYRSNPFDYFPEGLIDKTGVLVEDMVFSALYAYYFGLDSMGPAKGAFARSAHPTSFDMDVRKFDRCRTEIDKIEAVFPQLKILSPVLKRVATQPQLSVGESSENLKDDMWQAYYDLHNAMTKISRLHDGITSDSTEWGRLR